MVDRMVSDLESNIDAKPFYSPDRAHSGGEGEFALRGYTHFKARHDPEHPMVKMGIDASRQIARNLDKPMPPGGKNKSVYATAIAALLLAEVDPETYVRELKAFNQHFQRLQKREGGYGYTDKRDGDVSQTQYAMLALWKLARLGINIDDKGIAKTGSWLMAVQDVSGAWPYTGVVPPRGQRIKQNGVTASMAVAGGSALLIAGDILKTWGGAFNEANNPQIADLPKAVRLPEKTLILGKPKISANMASAPALESISMCDRWIDQNGAVPGVGHHSEWPMYQLYTLERYMSYRDIALELEEEDSPQWYIDGVDFLKSKLGSPNLPRGEAMSNQGAACFAVLFLIRSTKASIAESNRGSAIGGWGLPDDTSEVKVVGGQVKGKDIAGSVTDLLAALEGDGADDLAGKSIPDNLQLATSGPEREDQLNRLERLARGSQSWQARRVAMRLLGQSDDMDRVPTLIYGLSDPDSKVKIYARDGLRFISRKFDGFDMPRKPSQAEIYSAQKKWKQWYLTMRPEYIFLD